MAMAIAHGKSTYTLLNMGQPVLTSSKIYVGTDFGDLVFRHVPFRRKDFYVSLIFGQLLITSPKFYIS
jgi:hypothetical protein